MEFILTTKDKINKFITVFKHLKNVSDAINITFTPDGLYIQTMDGSHICMFEMKLNHSWFDEYTIEENCILGVNPKIIGMVCNCYEDGQIIKWKMESPTSDKVQVSFMSNADESKEFNKDFEVPLMDLDEELMQVPEDSEWQMDMVIMSHRLTKILAQLENFGDDLTWIASEEKMTLKCTGEHGSIHATIDNDNLEEYSIEEDTQVKVSYSMKYLKLITMFSKLNDRTIMNVSECLPLRIQYCMSDPPESSDEEETEYGLENMDECSSYARFFLAPKMDDY